MRSRESTVLVTGGLGYIGSYVVTRLVDAGWKVRIADNRYRSDPAVEARLAQLAQAVPVRRLGRPDDVARAVMFLSAEDNGFVTGQTLFVCGGTSVGSIVY